MQVLILPPFLFLPNRTEIFTAPTLGANIHTGEEVAIKLAHRLDQHASNLGSLENESIIFGKVIGKAKQGRRLGIPRALWYGIEAEYYVFVTDLLGPSLDDLACFCGGSFSLKTVLMIADQAICRLQTIHSSGYLHRDVKPHNFLLGTGRDGTTLYTIDMGLGGSYESAWRWYSVGAKRSFMGTIEYASLNNHLEIRRFLFLIPIFLPLFPNPSRSSA